MDIRDLRVADCPLGSISGWKYAEAELRLVFCCTQVIFTCIGSSDRLSLCHATRGLRKAGRCLVAHNLATKMKTAPGPAPCHEQARNLNQYFEAIENIVLGLHVDYSESCHYAHPLQLNILIGSGLTLVPFKICDWC